MTAREQYKYAQRIIRLFGINKHNHIDYDAYLSHLAPYRADILMAAWQTL